MGLADLLEAPAAELTILGNIDCYTLDTYARLSAMDTCGCMDTVLGMSRTELAVNQWRLSVIPLSCTPI
jgi:hypothetical protein